MRNIISIIFALVCFGTAYVSGQIMGAGMWFWVIIGTGFFVAFSQHLTAPPIRLLGVVVAIFLSLVSICAVVFGLVAATIGGSFKLENQEAMLLFLFFLIAVFGLLLAYISKRTVKLDNKPN